MENIKQKIKKLLAVANNASASENESETAMAMAMGLMTKYNLQVNLVDDELKPISGEQRFHQLDENWHKVLVAASAMLFACTSIVFPRGGCQFIGRPQNVEAAEDTLLYLVNQVERLYKQNLPKGLSKGERAEYRRTFKWACAVRVNIRAQQIVNSIKSNDEAALKYTGSRALVVVESIKAQLEEARAFMEKEFPDLRPAKYQPKKLGSGTEHGRMAGDLVEINRKVR